jgi:hypothetical protein
MHGTHPRAASDAGAASIEGSVTTSDRPRAEVVPEGSHTLGNQGWGACTTVSEEGVEGAAGSKAGMHAAGARSGGPLGWTAG